MPILRALGASGDAPGSDAVPHLVDEFTVEGPNGTHPCYATSPALANLRDTSFSRLFRIDVARALCYELTLALAFVHSRGFVHGDVHLGNILVRARDSLNDLTVAQLRQKFGEPDVYKVTRTDGEALPPNVPGTAVVALDMGKKAQDFSIQDARLMLSDFGESFIPASEVRLGKDCHTVFDSRPPEAYFEPDAPMSFPSDVWSLAIAIWDIIGMQPLFSSAFYSKDAVRCQIVDQLGPMPAEWFQKWPGRGIFFDEHGQPIQGRRPWPGIEQAFEDCVQSFRRQDDMGVFCDEESAALLNLVRKLLAYRPEQRPTLQQIITSEWMSAAAAVTEAESLVEDMCKQQTSTASATSAVNTSTVTNGASSSSPSVGSSSVGRGSQSSSVATPGSSTASAPTSTVVKSTTSSRADSTTLSTATTTTTDETVTITTTAASSGTRSPSAMRSSKRRL